MKIILMQDIAGVGRKFDIKEVADGYALNFLIPQAKAKHASAGAVKEIEKEKEKAKELSAQREAKTMQKLSELKKEKISLERKATEEGHLFAKVDGKDIAKSFKANGVEIDEDDIRLDQPIKQTGVHKIGVKVGEQKIEMEIEVKGTE